MTAAQRSRFVIAGIVAVAAGLAAALFVHRLIPREVSRDQFLAEVRRRQLKQATLQPLDHGSVAVADYGNPGAIRTVLPDDGQSFATELRALGVEVVYDTSDDLIP